MARADREKVHQIVINLVSNAINFTEPGGCVTVACDRAGRQQLRVHVTDTGRGIAADQLERVFHPFVQVDPTLTRTQPGTGLGLAISRELARVAPLRHDQHAHPCVIRRASSLGRLQSVLRKHLDERRARRIEPNAVTVADGARGEIGGARRGRAHPPH